MGNQRPSRFSVQCLQYLFHRILGWVVYVTFWRLRPNGTFCCCVFGSENKNNEAVEPMAVSLREGRLFRGQRLDNSESTLRAEARSRDNGVISPNAREPRELPLTGFKQHAV